MSELDVLVKNVRVVRPKDSSTPRLDLGIKDGRFVQIGQALDTPAKQVIDAGGLLGFPGVTDAHTHIGIYRDLAEDARSESAAAVSGGVTTLLTYIRTGSLYLNRPGPVKDFVPELLALSEGNYYCDYGYHFSPIQGSQIGEMEYLLTEVGAPNFGEIFMFYGSHGLHGGSDVQRRWLMLDEGESYDLAHFDLVCREAARLQKAYPELEPYISVSWHCELPDLLRAYEKVAMNREDISGLAAYSAARPPHNEALSVATAGALAHEAGLSRINLLHITSIEAMDAALRLRKTYPGMDVGLEVTAGHLLLDTDCQMGVYAKVNPPLRPPEHREYLWEQVLDGTLQWAMTDHASCPKNLKVDASDPENIWKAKAGFGGAEYLLPGLFSEGTRRGMSPNQVADLVCYTPARRFGLNTKGDIDLGLDADLVLLDPDESWTIRADDSLSYQGYTPFEGLNVKGKVKQTFVRGNLVFNEGEVKGEPKGHYLKRPTGGTSD